MWVSMTEPRHCGTPRQLIPQGPGCHSCLSALTASQACQESIAELNCSEGPGGTGIYEQSQTADCSVLPDKPSAAEVKGSLQLKPRSLSKFILEFYFQVTVHFNILLSPLLLKGFLFSPHASLVHLLRQEGAVIDSTKVILNIFLI